MRINLINRRKMFGYTQKQMAEMLEISRSNYNNYELGTVSPPLDKVLKIKQILNYKKDDLFFLDDNVSKTDKKKEG